MLHVTSEFGRLREAIVHRPGHELVRMTPSTRDYFVFDDLLYDDHARQEHDWLTDLLQNHLGVKVYYFEELLGEALSTATDIERQAIISQVCLLESDMPAVEQRIGQLEVLVRWFQGQGWPQYTQDPQGDPKAAAPGTLPGTLTSLLSHSPGGETAAVREAREEAGSFDYLQYRLESWSSAGNSHVLAEELIQGIEARIATSPTERPGPPDNGNHDNNGPNGNKQANGNGHTPPIHASDGDVDALRRYVEGRLFYLTPLPNLMFVRDVATVVNNRLLLARMAAPGRTREPLLLDFVQRNHPRFRGTARWTWADARINDPAWPVASSPLLHLEGGNIIQLREDIVVVGVNERTTLEAAQRIADAWRAEAIKDDKQIILYVLRLPVGFNHLDSVFSVINHDECIIYPPVFEPYGPASVDVVRIELSAETMQPTRAADFFESLRNDGMNLTCIPCGGSDPVDQQREQWFSAANLLALAPGKVVIFRSSEQTLAALSEHGYQIVDITDIQTGAVNLDLDSPGKWALKIKGSELSRGHGGPHSLVLPLVRDS